MISKSYIDSILLLSIELFEIWGRSVELKEGKNVNFKQEYDSSLKLCGRKIQLRKDKMVPFLSQHWLTILTLQAVTKDNV